MIISHLKPAASACLVCLLLLAIGPELPAGAAWGAEPRWKSGGFTHLSKDEPLKSLIESLASAHGMSAVVSPRVTGRISGSFQNQDPQAFLESIAHANGLIWYCEGSILYVYRAEEIRTRMIQLQTTTISKLAATLKEAGIYDSRYPFKGIRGDGLAHISGPPRYVELVSRTAARMDAKSIDSAPAFSDNQLVRIYPLKFAWAADYVGTAGNRQLLVPGVATLLNALITRQPLGSEIAARAVLQNRTEPGEASAVGNTIQFAVPFGLGTGAPGPAQVSIQADVRTNSVVIKDTRENLQRFQSLVNALDVPSGLVELNISILDISSASTMNLGVEWQFFSEGARFGRATTSVMGQKFSDLTPDGKPGVPNPVEGYSIAALAENAASSLLARIQALELAGKAKVAARPAVLTFDNVEARISQIQTFHVRVAGEREAKLFRVEAGTNVRVTPHIVEEGRDRSIKLIIDIDDGSLAEAGAVDNIPIVATSTVSTQAIVDERQSLLLGGFIRTEEAESRSRVPFLGAIPVLGHLFSKTEKVRRKVERVFMISPRIIRTAAEAGGAFELDDTERAGETPLPEGRRSSLPGGAPAAMEDMLYEDIQ